MPRPATIKIAVGILLIDVLAYLAEFINDRFISKVEDIPFEYFENIPIVISIYLIWFGRKWVRNWYLAFLIIAISLSVYGHIANDQYLLFTGWTSIIYELKGFGVHVLWLCLLYTNESEHWFDEYTREMISRKMIKIEEKYNRK